MKGWIYLFLLFPIHLNGAIISDKNILPPVQNYSRKDYSGSAQNWAIGQKPNDKILVANNTSFLTYANSLWENIYSGYNPIRCFYYCKNDNRIYIGGYNHFGYLALNESQKIEYHSLNKNSLTRDYIWGEVWHIYELNNEIYFQAGQAVFIKPDGKDTITHIFKQKNIEYSTVIDGEMIMSVADIGIVRYDKNIGLQAIKGGEIFASKKITSIIRMNNQKWLISTLSDGLYDLEFSHAKALDTPLSDILKVNQIYCAIKTGNDHYAFGTIQDGVYITDNNLNIIYHLNRQNGLQNNTVLSLGEDADANLWLGLDNGIDHILLNSPLKKISLHQDIGTPYVSRFVDNSLYVGTNKGLFLLTNLKSDIKITKIESLNGQVWALDIIDGKLYCGHHNGAFRITGSDAELISSSPGAYNIFELKNTEGYYFQVSYRVYNLYKLGNGGLKLVKQLPPPARTSNTFCEERTGSIWTIDGGNTIHQFKLDTTKPALIKVNSFNYSAIPVWNDVRYIRLALYKNQVIFSTNKGFLVFDSNNNQLITTPILKGLTDEEIYPGQLYEDTFERVWFKSSKHFGFIKSQSEYNDKTIQFFNQIIKDISPSQQLVSVLDQNNVLIHSLDGLMILQPELLENHKINYQTLLNVSHTKFSNPPVRDSLSVLEYPHNSIKFRFLSNDFNFNGKILYRFKLSGFDEDWSEWSTNDTKEYTNLREGSYEFAVESKNSNEQHSAPARFYFEITPPFYRSGIAYLLYVVLIFSGLYVFLYRLKSYIKSREDRLKEKQRHQLEEIQRINELQKLRSEKIIMDHEKEMLENEIIYKSEELVNHTRVMIEKNQMLTSILNELGELVKWKDLESRNKKLNSIMTLIKKNMDNDQEWRIFKKNFNKVHLNFFEKLLTKYPDLSSADLQLSAYLRMNKSTKEIASLMNISERGVETGRYRLRKKMGMVRDHSIADVLLKI